MGQRANQVGGTDPQDYSAVDRDVVVNDSDYPYTTGDAVVNDRDYQTDESGDPEAIRADIERTRADMSETIDALQERLSPTHLKEQAQEQFNDYKEQVKDQVREQFYEAKQMVRDATIGRVENMVNRAGDTAYEARGSMMETIKHNPIPAALVGLGLGWLFMNRRSAPQRHSGRGSGRGSLMYEGGQRSYADRPEYYERGVGYYERPYGQGERGYTERGYDQRFYSQSGQDQQRGGIMDRAQERASNVASTVSDTASNVASTVSDTASNVASTVSDTASYYADQAQYQYQRAEDRFEQAIRNNPLAVGAIALAIGTAVGLAVPVTEKENQLMGETRDNLLDRAQEVAQDTFEKVQQVAGNVVDEAKTTVKEQAREQGLTNG